MTRAAIIEQIERALAARGARREGAELRFRCPHPDRHRNGDEHPSARWNPGKRVWHCPVCGAGGGYGTLAHSLGIESTAHLGPRVGQNPCTERKQHDGQSRIQAARRLWFAARHAEKSLVETYLRSRGITVELPETIRFLPRAWHSEAKSNFPAMIAAVQDHGGRLVSIHRTFLSNDGQGKARVEPVKMMLGQCAGGAVRLAQAGSVLAVTEGIETGLSVLAATGLATWAGLSAGGISTLVLPPLPVAAQVIIFADHDRAGIEAAERAALRWHYEDRSVRVALPPTPGRDFNDLLRGVA